MHTQMHTPTYTQMENPLPRKRLEDNLASRQDRLHGSGAGLGQRSMLSTWTNSVYPLIPFIFPHFLLPKSPKSLLGSSPKCPVWSWNAFPWHPPMCPMPQDSNPVQSQKCPGLDSSWWVSHLGIGAKALLGQPWEGVDRMSPPLSLQLGFPPAFALVFPQASRVGWCYQGWRLLLWVWEEPGQGVIWCPPPAFDTLCPFVGVPMIFYLAITISLSRPLFSSCLHCFLKYHPDSCKFHKDVIHCFPGQEI